MVIKKRKFQIGELIISNFVPQLAIMHGYNKVCKIVSISYVTTIDNSQYLVADVEVLNSDIIEKDTLIPLHNNVTLFENSIYTLGKEIRVNNLGSLEQRLYAKLFKHIIKPFLQGKQATISNVNETVKELLNSLANKSIKFYTTNGFIKEEKYLPLIIINKSTKKEFIYGIPILDYFNTLIPYNSTEIIDKNFNNLVLELKEIKKNEFLKAKEQEFNI